MVEGLSINLDSRVDELSIDFTSHIYNAKCNVNFTLCNERLRNIKLIDFVNSIGWRLGCYRIYLIYWYDYKMNIIFDL